MMVDGMMVIQQREGGCYTNLDTQEGCFLQF